GARAWTGSGLWRPTRRAARAARTADCGGARGRAIRAPGPRVAAHRRASGGRGARASGGLSHDRRQHDSRHLPPASRARAVPCDVSRDHPEARDQRYPGDRALGGGGSTGAGRDRRRAAGLGVALVSRHAVLARDRRIVAARLAGPRWTRDLLIVRRVGTALGPAADAFWRLLLNARA